MNAAVLALIGILFFATEATLISRNLAKVSPLFNLAMIHSVTGIVGIIIVIGGKQSGHTWSLPQGNQWSLVILCGILLVCGDVFFLSALRTGRLQTVTMIFCLMPVAATVINYLLGRSLPNASDLLSRALPTTNEVVAWSLAVIAIMVVTFKPFKE